MKLAAVLVIALTACGGSKQSPPPTTPAPSAPAPGVSAPATSVTAEVAGAERGKTLFDTKGCVACHTVDGSAKIGPSLLKAFGTKRRLENGSEVMFDEAYFKESLFQPAAKIVASYPAVHPSFEGQLTDVELESLLLYIKSLR